MGDKERDDLLKQAERAENLADQASDQEVVDSLRDAAKDYRREAEGGDAKPLQK